MDLKYALRSLRKNPGFTILAVLVMALGIGANTAMFSVVNAVLLKPLNYRDPDRIVTISNHWKKTGLISPNISAPDFHDWHDQSSAFEAMAYHAGLSTSVVTKGVGEYARVALVSPEFFRVFGVDATLGRLFTPEEEKPGGVPAVVVSHAYWRSHLGGNQNALGQTLRIFDTPLTVVGVLPGGFAFPADTEIWALMSAVEKETTSRSAHNYTVEARLKPGATLAQAQAQMESIAARLERLYPQTNQGKGVAVSRMRDTLVRNVRLTLILLLAAVGLVLLIACANVANLMLAKAMSRNREIAIRAAVGASRGRIIRQLVIESAVLAMVSGLVGTLLAIWGADALVAIAPSNVPRLAESKIDASVLAFTFAVSLLASLLFGLAPALQVSRVDLNDALKQGASKVLGGGAGRLRNGLIVAEIALSAVLLISAGLVIRSFQALSNVELGFRPEKILVAQASMPVSSVASARRASQIYKGILAELTTLPGAAAVGGTMAPPGTIRSNGGYWIDHLPGPEGLNVSAPQAVFSVVTPGLFNTLGIAFKQGREFDESDTFDGQFTAIINQELARKSFAGQDPVGRVIFCGMDSPKPMKIVGVVGNVRQWGPATASWPEIYMPYQQHPGFAAAISILVRTTADPGSLTETLRRKLRERAPEAPVKFTTMEASLAANVAAPRFRTLLLTLFAGLAVCLTIAGVYGVMAYVVGQRLNEIGLRMALGARPRDVRWLVVRHALLLTGIGVVTGLAAAIAATCLLSSVLFEVKATDPATYAGVALLLVFVALVASYLPARRATRVDPLIALRQE